MNSLKWLSIITINYNNVNGLKKTLESVINQTSNEYEFIVIDGGSTDGSKELLKVFAQHFTYCISEEDNGIYHAMNKGIKQAHGDYCFFLNSGDYFVNEAVIERISGCNFKEDVIFGNLLVFYNDVFIGRSAGKEKLTFLDVYVSLIKHQSTLIRRKLFDKYGCYNEALKIVADWEFFIKTVGLGGVTYRYLNIDIACFDNNGISNNSEQLTVNERKSVIEACIPEMMQADYAYLYKNANYEIVTNYSITRFLLRILVKVSKILRKIFSGE